MYHGLMEDFDEDLEDLRDDLEAVERAIGRLKAKKAGLAAQIEALERLDRPSDRGPNLSLDLALMARTDAIVTVIGRSDRPLGPADIRKVLLEGGREDDYQVVASTLSYLAQAGRVNHPRRGFYEA